MITHSPNKLLQTIHSRSWEIRFSPLELDELKSHFQNKYPNYTESDLENLIINYDYNITDIFDALNDEVTLSKFNFIEFYRLIYKEEYFEAQNMLNEYDVFRSRNNAINLIHQFQNFNEILIKNKIDILKNNDYEKLITNLDLNELVEFNKKCIDYSNLIEANINLNLLWFQVLHNSKNIFKSKK